MNVRRFGLIYIKGNLAFSTNFDSLPVGEIHSRSQTVPTKQKPTHPTVVLAIDKAEFRFAIAAIGSIVVRGPINRLSSLQRTLLC